MTEASIVSEIIKKANRRPLCKAIKVHVGVYSLAGTPDVHITQRGRSFWFEVKRPTRRRAVTKKQRHELDQWNLAGAVAYVVTSWDEVQKFLDDEL